eukprot:CAMPEP_0115131036 /NCGR_PEP_ID=MMETSP0227-20121206/52848_1 /TAXON_ID=89957 /ORGANISM="Polarella glacialis, Strain CCMP 1383" /LENGTH=49 /DNA_ID=CAMNT_0002536421 /DNA_START=82 /DNA_END=232 /DNA_ORIENTATION=+
MEDTAELKGVFWEKAAQLKALVCICRALKHSNPADFDPWVGRGQVTLAE